jgi:hypothetical protein
MVARIKPEPNALVVEFERDGEEPVRVAAANGEKAVLRAVAILLAHQKLHAGDRLWIKAAD